MPQLRPSWQLSLTTAVCLVVVAAVCSTLLRGRRGAGVSAAFAREFTLVMCLLGLWQYVGGYVHTRVAGAVERGREIDALEAWLHAPSERVVQQVFLPHPWLVEAANTYYAYAHINGMALFVVWLWWRHRDAYPAMRLVMVVSTLACFLIQIVPVAPPRLLPDLGFVDTAAAYGQSVYGDLGTGLANQVSAMPSVHVGWAAIVAGFVWRCAPPLWRWIGPLHLGLTVLVVTATANHWWLDGAVAAALVVLAAVLGAALRAGLGAARQYRSAARRPTGWRHDQRRERLVFDHDPAGTSGQTHRGQ